MPPVIGSAASVRAMRRDDLSTSTETQRRRQHDRGVRRRRSQQGRDASRRHFGRSVRSGQASRADETASRRARGDRDPRRHRGQLRSLHAPRWQRRPRARLDAVAIARRVVAAGRAAPPQRAGPGGREQARAARPRVVAERPPARAARRRRSRSPPMTAAGNTWPSDVEKERKRCSPAGLQRETAEGWPQYGWPGQRRDVAFAAVPRAGGRDHTRSEVTAGLTVDNATIARCAAARAMASDAPRRGASSGGPDGARAKSRTGRQAKKKTATSAGTARRGSRGAPRGAV